MRDLEPPSGGWGFFCADFWPLPDLSCQTAHINTLLSYVAHLVFILAIGGTVSYNAATWYFSVFLKDYQVFPRRLGTIQRKRGALFDATQPPPPPPRAPPLFQVNRCAHGMAEGTTAVGVERRRLTVA